MRYSFQLAARYLLHVLSGTGNSVMSSPWGIVPTTHRKQSPSATELHLATSTLASYKWLLVLDYRIGISDKTVLCWSLGVTWSNKHIYQSTDAGSDNTHICLCSPPAWSSTRLFEPILYWKGNKMFYLTHFIYGHMAWEIWHRTIENPLPPPHGLLFPLGSKGSFKSTIPQTW